MDQPDVDGQFRCMANMAGEKSPVGEGETNNDADRPDDPEERRADSDFDDLVIEVDESEVEAELRGRRPGRT